MMDEPLEYGSNDANSKHVEECETWAPWIIFGEYPREPGDLVDVSDASRDIVTRIPRDKAEQLVKLRDEYLDAARKLISGRD